MGESLTAMRTCMLADQYDISGLLEIATKRFEFFVSVWEMERVADDLDDFADLVKLVEAGGSFAKLMRTVIVPALIDSEAVAMSDDVAEKVAQLMTECPDFAVQYLKQTAKRLMYAEGLGARRGKEQEYRCPACEHKFTRRGDQGYPCPKCGHDLSRTSWAAFMV